MKKFETPELEIVKLSCDDIITTSDGCNRCNEPYSTVCKPDCVIV